jgi:formylglycine-generating enzyme required for sulfatase activity
MSSTACGAALILLASVLSLPPAADAGDFRDPATGMEFVTLAGGEFMMGDTAGTGRPSERPAYPVRLSGYAIGRYEVTVAQYRMFAQETGYRTGAEVAGEVIDIDPEMGTFARVRGISWRSPGFEQEESDPVVWVNWNDAVAFTAWLSGKGPVRYRLPTEAEWEYAARSGGREERWPGTADVRNLAAYSWYAGNSGGRTHPVGVKKPNALGIHDMSGNVWEWCLDWQGTYPREGRLLRDPVGVGTSGLKALRGGSWRTGEAIVTSTYRNGYKTGYAHSSIGFRVAFSREGTTASLLPPRPVRPPSP